MKAHLRKVKLLLLFTAALCINVTAQDSWTWTQRYDGPKHLNAVAASSDGLFAAVGNAGTILTSPNGVDWTETDSITDLGLHSIIWGDGMFVAGGDSGIIVTSKDGVEWVVRRSGGNGPIQSIVWGDGKYVASTTQKTINPSVFTSDNGINWVEKSISCNGSECSDFVPSFKSITYGNGAFVTYGDWSSTFTSSDGIQWKGGQKGNLIIFDDYGMPGPMDFNTVVYGNGVFLLAGNCCRFLAKSEGGETWDVFPGISAGGTGYLESYYVLFDGNRFVIIVDTKGIYFSESGEFLEQISTKSWSLWYGPKLSIAYNGDVYVTVYGTEIGTLSESTSSIVNSKRTAKLVSDFKIYQRGKTLKIVMPNQNTHPKIALFNLAGKRQRSKQVFHKNGTVSLSLVGLATGTYVLRVNDGRKNWQSKIIVK